MAGASGATRIVVIGGGYAGAYCAQKLERLVSRDEAQVTLIDRNNYFIIFPLLVEAGTGSIEPRHTVVSIRSFLRRAEFRMMDVEGIDTGARRVRCRIAESGQEVDVAYDHLVIALGSVTKMPPVPGLREYGMEMKSLADAVGLRDRTIRMLETAAATEDVAARRAILHLVVVGANFTGAEVAGEMEAFMRGAVRQYPNLSRSDVKVTLVERSSRILGALDEDLARYATEKMRARGIDVRLNQSVTAIDAEGVTLTTGERLAARMVVWAAGIEPPPVIGGDKASGSSAGGLPRDERGYLICERDLRVKGFENVWGIGDCAVNTDKDGKAYPATAQHGIREGVHAARNIARVIRGQAATPCDIVSQGSLAALGCRTGVANVFGIKFSGFVAWWLWRTVYLMKMPGLGRKVRIALDWTLELLFKRDYVQLGVHRIDREG
jgi:NADH:ubiquinone reductase (H+-translocating)